jgi:CRISPR-associated endoribonuclease Cas6
MGRFSIRLPEELMKMLYETGVGEKGSMGFGMVEFCE